MKYIVMCGGEYSEWVTPRQLIQIHGEPIVLRTIRLLTEAGIDDISISSNDKRFEQFGVPVLNHENHYRAYPETGSWVEAFYPTEEPACYLMGDVVYSPEAIRAIVSKETEGIEFFASAPPFDKKYIKPWAEPFAFKVEDQKAFRNAIETVKSLEKAGVFNRRPISWELWQVIKGTPLNVILCNYTVVNDYTCDIDSAEDVEMMRGLVE